MIAGSRGSLPLNLQGLWLDGNDPDWMGDYHTDINLQMNYWMADRAALSDCFDAFTDHCLAQLPSWTELTRTRFDDPRNRYRNSTGKLAGWTVAISTNIHGGMGWWWHPAATPGCATPSTSTTSSPRTAPISPASTRCSRGPASSGRRGC